MTAKELEDFIKFGEENIGAATFLFGETWSKHAITIAKELRDRLEQPEPEPVKWFPAPTKTKWGEGLVMADLAIDNDHVVSIYCEADQVKKVEAMFKNEWVGFTHEELGWLNEALNLGGRLAVIEAIEAKLKEKNT